MKKKLLLSSALVITIAPIATVISCGDDEKEVAKNNATENTNTTTTGGTEATTETDTQTTTGGSQPIVDTSGQTNTGGGTATGGDANPADNSGQPATGGQVVTDGNNNPTDNSGVTGDSTSTDTGASTDTQTSTDNSGASTGTDGANSGTPEVVTPTESKYLQTQLIPDGLSEMNYRPSEFSNDSKVKLKELRAMRINFGKGWEPIGDTIIDVTNDIRFAAYREAMGDSSARIKFAEFVNTVKQWRENILGTDTSTLTEPSQVSTKLMIESLKSFLDTGDLSITTGLGAGLNPNDDTLGLDENGKPLPIGSGAGESNRYYGYHDPEELKQMQPLQPGWKAMGFAQYRAQQIEWNGGGGPDGHNWHATAQRTEPYSASASTGAKKPQEWIDGGDSLWESYGFLAPVKPVEWRDNKRSTVTTWEAWTGVFDLFSDQGGNTHGSHRANMMNPYWNQVGWSVSLDSWGDIGSGRYNVSLWQEFRQVRDTNGITDEFDWFVVPKRSDIGYFTDRLDLTTVPSNWDSMSKEDRLDLFKDGTIHFLKTIDGVEQSIEVRYWVPEFEHATVLPEDPTQVEYLKLKNTVMHLKPYQGIDTPTYVYNVLETGVQAHFEDKTYDEWKKNLLSN